MLAQAVDTPNLECLINQTKGVVFYSVPHQGSPLAAMTNQTKYLLYPSVEVKELAPGTVTKLQWAYFVGWDH